MIITIDGPAGSGKSSTARAVARRLGLLHLDSGAVYRAFARAAIRGKILEGGGAPDREAARAVAREPVTVEAMSDGLEVRLGGRRLGAELRTPEVTALSSKLSVFPEVRDRVNALLREVAGRYRGSMVCEGRDMGTVVFPEAELKVYLIASTEVRARRRLEQQGIEPEPERVRAEIARLERRDRSDRERAVAPLRPAPDAELIDTTDLAFEDQVRQIVEMARKRLDMAEGSG